MTQVLNRRQAAALVTENPGVAVSLNGVIATIRKLTYCGACRSEVAEDHQHPPAPPREAA